MFDPDDADKVDTDLLLEVFEAYTEKVGVHWEEMLGYGLAALAVALLWSAVIGRRRAAQPWEGERWLRLALVVGLIGVGLWQAFERATCFDDAYISLRYAENFVAGKGLVWNEGEYVEGYTNFLWVMLVSLFMWLTPLEAPLIAVLGSMLAFATNLWVVWRISLKIAPPFHKHGFAFPIAVALLAVQNTFTDFGTTGLETAFASLLVNLGLLALLHDAPPDAGPAERGRSGAKTSFGAGLCWILATLTRPDHALFYAIGSAVVLGIWVRPTWRARSRGLRAIWREGLRPMLTYAAPFLIWLIYSAWKLDYYGELLPNTYYAKSAYDTYYSQGLIYAATFHLASHLWIVILAVLVLWPWRPPSNTPGRRFLAFAVPAILAYEWYVVRVGGDFMYGRFYVTLIPLILLCGEQVVHEFSMTRSERKQALARMRGETETEIEFETETGAQAPPQRSPLRAGALVMIVLMASSATGVRLFDDRHSRWNLTDESSYYPIVEWSPIVIDHANYRVGVILGRLNEGLEGKQVADPILATGAIGLLGYYSQMTVIDRLGLTDATVAHQEIEKRGRPGHEKWAKAEYIRERGVHFIRGGGYPKWFRSHGRIRWGKKTGGRRWYILEYDRELMNAIRELDPDVSFQDFETYIDRYIARMPQSRPKRVRKEWEFFKTYYFDHNSDPERRAAFATYFQWVREGNKPKELLEDGRWDVYKKRGAEASKREQKLRRERIARQRAAEARTSRGLFETRLETEPKPKPKPKSKPVRTTNLKPVPRPPSGEEPEVVIGELPDDDDDDGDDDDHDVVAPAEDDGADDDDDDDDDDAA
ncbi:MAG: hypothetical protein R6X02_19885 [Enhygromyxa sp.]